MDSVKYIGMDVHQEAISIAVLNSSGKLVMGCTIESKAITILEFLKGLRGLVSSASTTAAAANMVANGQLQPGLALRVNLLRGPLW
jgi:hypothetical protein